MICLESLDFIIAGVYSLVFAFCRIKIVADSQLNLATVKTVYLI